MSLDIGLVSTKLWTITNVRYARSCSKGKTLAELIISVSGLRGVFGDSLTTDVATRYALAFSEQISPGPIVITRDGRTSGELLFESISSALLAAGRDVYDGDISATPTTGILVRHLSCAGGIQISASHNPKEYNGMKLFSEKGRVLKATAGALVLQRYRDHDWQPAQTGCGSSLMMPVNSHVVHLERILTMVNVQQIRKRRFKLLLDSNHGAGSRLGSQLLKELNCDVLNLGGVPDGNFDHEPEPTAENLADVCNRVEQTGCQLGFCQDPDADRLAVIDEAGQYIGEEYTLALCAHHLLRQRTGPIVTNCATSRMTQDLAEQYGAGYYRTAVGEANVVETMEKRLALFGGEGNGGPIDPRVGYVRDSFVGIALILDALAQRNMQLSEWVAELPRYYIHKTKVGTRRVAKPGLLENLVPHFPGAIADSMDGLRFDWPGRWLLIRPSNTEPVIRIIAEARTSDEATTLCHQAKQLLQAANT